MGELRQLQLLANELGTLSETQMTHTLKRVLAGQPLCLLIIEHSRASLPLGILNQESSLSPSSYDVMLAVQLDTCSAEDIRRSQPCLTIRTETAKPQEDDESLDLQGVLPPAPIYLVLLGDQGTVLDLEILRPGSP